MADYIDREAVFELLRDEDFCVTSILAIPAADVQPVVHGHWSIRCETHHDTYTGETDEEFYLECSECKRQVWDVSQDAILMGDYRRAIADFPYCHCGAKMDAEE